MFDHVFFNVSNQAESTKFYNAVLQILGIRPLYDQHPYTGYGIDSLKFWLHQSEAKDVTRKAHLAFSAGSRELVDEFYRVALQAGANSQGAPSVREHSPTYYAAYVLDLDGNNIEAVCNK